MNKELSEQELIALAASWDDTKVGRHREKDGTVPGWTRWSQVHAQKDEPIIICRGQDEWKHHRELNEQNFPQLSIVSWNILSDTWWRKQKGEGDFAHTPAEHGEWSFRLRRLLKWIENLNPDVLALQELDYEKFDDLNSALTKLGYEGSIQTPKKKAEKQPCGTATFWKAKKLQLQKEASFSRTQCVVLSCKDKRQLIVTNVHLESSQSAVGADRRARQLNSALAYAAAEAPNAALIVCGDFNTGKSSKLFHVLRDRHWHNHSLSSVYEHPGTFETLLVRHASFMVPGHHYSIDHMLYDHDVLKLKCALDAFSEEESQEHVHSKGIDAGFPSTICPSDHIPIGAVFELLPRKESRNQTSTQEEPVVSEERKQELLQQWDYLQSQQPPRIKGKPTAEQIAERKTHATLVKDWKESIENEAERVFATILIKGRSFALPGSKK